MIVGSRSTPVVNSIWARLSGPDLPPGLRSEANCLLAVMLVGFGIRLYLALTSYCISGDGVAYLGMAHYFSAAEWHAALGAVFSPLYPALISVMHYGVTNWEMAGELVSVILGTAAVATTYLMTREALGSRQLGLGAAILMAIHPETAAYSASVRTEAGYMFLTTGACWLLLRAVKERQLRYAAVAGIAAGLGYLYRTEAVGFLPLGGGLFLASGWLWNRVSRRWALSAACIFATVFAIIAAPYVAYLRVTSGHWSIGREFTAAMMYGMGDVAQHGERWRQFGWSASASPLATILSHPRLYAQKVGQDVVVSTYSFAQALQPLLTVMLAIGIWVRRRGFFIRAGEAFLATIVLFYFCGFALSYTGTRFMAHLLPFTFGWVAAGVIAASEQAAQWCKPGRRKIVHAVIPTAIAIALLPRTLWPLGYDMRGVRYAGEDIAQMKKGPVLVAARDGRVAYYAGARLVELPLLPPEDFCGWLAAQGGNFLMVANQDEELFNIARHHRCLELLRRYPRYGAGYYDLYAVRVVHQVRQGARSPAGSTIR